MAKGNKNNQSQEKHLDLKTLKKTVFFDGEKERKENRSKNKKCPYRTKLVWNAEKNKYERIKIYKKRTTFTKKEMKERFSGTGVTVVQPKKVEPKSVVHGKAEVVKMKPITHHYMRGVRLDWDQETLKYKVAA